MVSADLISKSDLFGGMNAQDLEKIARLGNSREHARGINLFHQNEHISTLYIVQEGSVRLSMNVHIWERDMTLNSVVAVMEPGETFGWPALVEPNVATFSAETIGRCTLVEFPASELKQLMESDNGLGYRVMSRLASLIAERLRATQEAIQRLRADDLRDHL